MGEPTTYIDVIGDVEPGVLRAVKRDVEWQPAKRLVTPKRERPVLRAMGEGTRRGLGAVTRGISTGVEGVVGGINDLFDFLHYVQTNEDPALHEPSIFEFMSGPVYNPLETAIAGMNDGIEEQELTPYMTHMMQMAEQSKQALLPAEPEPETQSLDLSAGGAFGPFTQEFPAEYDFLDVENIDLKGVYTSMTDAFRFQFQKTLEAQGPFMSDPTQPANSPQNTMYGHQDLAYLDYYKKVGDYNMLDYVGNDDWLMKFGANFFKQYTDGEVGFDSHGHLVIEEGHEIDWDSISGEDIQLAEDLGWIEKEERGGVGYWPSGYYGYPGYGYGSSGRVGSGSYRQPTQRRRGGLRLTSWRI